jgi:hypothetical protein
MTLLQRVRKKLMLHQSMLVHLTQYLSICIPIVHMYIKKMHLVPLKYSSLDDSNNNEQLICVCIFS